MRTRERKPCFGLGPQMSRPVQLLLLVLTVSTGSLDEPSIVALIADDPDQSEEFFADFDTLSLHFWPPTTMPGGAEEQLDRDAVNDMLIFSSPIAGDYWAHWNSTTLLVITFGVVDPESAPLIGSFTVACRAGNDIRSGAAPAGECSSTSPPLRGSWGYTHPPSVSITSFTASDPDDADEVCGVGDRLTITFNVPTNRAQLSGIGGAIGGATSGPSPAPLLSGGGALDQLLEFVPAIPEANISAAWLNDQVLELHVMGSLMVADEAGDASPDASSGSDGSESSSGSGDDASGSGSGSGALDDGSGDSVGSGLLPAGDAHRVALFEWLGELRVSIRPGAALRDASESSAKTSTTSPPLDGDCGLPPQIVAFEAVDADDGDVVCGMGDTVALRFDRPTDMPPARTRVEVDRLITFSQALGSAYTGSWTDSTTLTITILATHSPPPEIGVAIATLRGASVSGATHLRNAHQMLRPSSSSSPPLSGSCGSPARVSRIEPHAGPAAGGMPVTIAGMDLVPSAHVRCVWQLGPTSTASTGAVPDSPPANKTYPPPASPPASPASCDAHGRRLQIGYTGDAYDPLRKMASEIATWQKHYDASVAPPLSMNTTAVVCMAPSASGADNATVAVDFGNGDTLPSPSATSLVYHYYAPPILSSVEPYAGSWRGGTQITIYGDFFRRDPTTVTTGNTTAAISSAQSSILHELSPACRFGHRAIEGWTNVSIVVPAIWNGSDRAICTSPPWPRRLWPPEPNGGLLSMLSLDFASNGIDADGWALRPDGGPTALPAWEHVDPVLSSVAPLSGPRASTTALTVFGRGLGVQADETGEMPSLCRVGAMAVQPLLAINATGNYVVCPAPPCPGCDQQSELSGADCCGLSVTLEVSVSTNGREWVTSSPDSEPVAFTYYDQPRVTSLGALPIGAPLSGPTLGGVSVTVRGVGFVPVDGMRNEVVCRFGSSVVGAIRTSDTGVLCVTPPMMAGTVPVAIAANGLDFQPTADVEGPAAVSTFQFEFKCEGYPDSWTCTADPSCGWCDGGLGCVACPSANGGGCSGSVAGGTLICDGLNVAASCGSVCPLLTERFDIMTPQQPLQLRMNVDAVLHNASSALYRIIPHHTNFALRVRLRSPPTTRSVRMYARKDLPPTGNPVSNDLYEFSPSGDSSLQRLVIGPDQLGCGQRDGERSGGTWPDLLRQAPMTRWSPIERELVGTLYPPSSRWATPPFESASVPHCDVWFVGVFPVAPPPPAPYQPSLVNDTLSDDPFNPNPPPPATYNLIVFLEPHYLNFACADCAPSPPRAPAQFLRDELLHAPPPPPSDRFGSTLHGDCDACGLRLRGQAERVVDEGGQRLRLVHSIEPHSPYQFGAVWYHQKLRVSHGFQIEFAVQFHRPSTCAKRDDDSESAGAAAEDRDAAAASEESLPYWQRRRTGCAGSLRGAGGKGAMTEGAVGGEGLALVIHNDPAGLEAEGCKGTGVGFSYDASHYGTCQERITNSLALQLSPHFNVSEAMRHGPHVALDEPSYITWGAIDEVGVYTNGDNGDPLVRRQFPSPGRSGSLIDGQRHTVLAVYSGGELRIRFDGEELPSLSVENLDLAQHGVFDAQGKAWIGFTASTGISSIDTDLLSFSFCQHPGCGAA